MTTTASPNTSLEQAQEAVAADMALFDDPEARYDYIIETGRALPPLPPELKTDAHKVAGCQSQVWLAPSVENGRVFFQGDSDALIVRGLVALALRVYSGHTPAAILAAPPNFTEAIGLGGQISMTRVQGLQSVIKTMQAYARALSEGDAP